MGRNEPKGEEAEDTIDLYSFWGRLWIRDRNKGSYSTWMVFKAMGLDKATLEGSDERARAGKGGE